MTAKENTLLKAKASVSWIYTNLLGKKATFELLHPTERKHAEEEYVAWVSYLLPIEQALTELEELKKRDTAMKPVEAMITWQCGKCGKEIRNTFNSCPYCRTRIDWGGIYGSGKDE